MNNQIDFIIAARHGEHRHHNLTMAGVQQAIDLGDTIKQLARGKCIEIFTSPIERAHETAKIIQDITKAPSLVTCASLENDRYTDGAVQLEEITASLTDKGKVVVVISHFEAPSGIIHAASSMFSTPRISYPCREIGRGEALVLEMKTGIVTHVPYNEPSLQH